LLKRIKLHNDGKGAKFTRGRKWKLLYYETFNSKIKAMKREYVIKKDSEFRKTLKLK
jgi:putative endonuclease